MALSNRPARLRAATTVRLALAALLALACDGDAPLVPPTPEPPGSDPAPRALGLMEVSFAFGDAASPSGARRDAASHPFPGVSAGVPAGASARGSGAVMVRASALALDTIAGGIQLEPVRTGSFTDGARGADGVRYVYATFRVRNAAADSTPYADARTNLTFVPVETSGTIAGTPFSTLERFDDTAASPAIAPAIKPTGVVHAAGASIVSSEPDVLQLFTEDEVRPEAEGGLFAVPATVATVFPYGFVTRRADGTTSTRTLPASPAADEYDGIVTFAFKVPLQATPAEDPFRISVIVQAVDDSTTRITQSLEEQDAAGTAAFEARAAALGATVATTLPALSPSTASTRCIAQVRTAGVAGAATDSLVDYDAFADYADLVVLLPGEGLDACEADHKSGPPADQTAGSDFAVEVVAVDGRGFVVDSVAHPVALSTSDAHGLVALPAAADLVNGRATLNGVTLITTGTPDDGLPTLTAADQTPGGPTTGAQPVPLTPAAGDPATVVVTADRTLQGPDGTVGVTATFQDAFGNAAWNRVVTFTSTLGTTSAATDNGDGSYTATLTMPAAANPAQADTASVGSTVDGSPGAGSAGVYLFAWTQVAAAESHTCGVATDSTAYCWGRNDAGQLGNGTAVDSHTPVQVANVTGFTQVSAFSQSTGNSTCGVTGAGTAYCWGDDAFGSLGDGTATTGGSTVPVQVANVTTFTQVSAGLGHACGVTTSGNAYCWGVNFAGELGDGTTTGSHVPTPVSNVTTFTQVSAGNAFSCGVTTEGTAYCWGDDGNGRLGDGTATTGGSTVPVQVANVTGFTQVAATAQIHACGLAAGSAYCWGDNSAFQLGNGTSTDSDVPVQVPGVSGFTQVSVGIGHSCGVVTGGTAYCWGLNAAGQLGDGTTTDRSAPVQVANITDFAQVSGGNGFASNDDHTCGVTVGGIAYCWGDNPSGQLGDGTTTDSTVPVRVVVP